MRRRRWERGARGGAPYCSRGGGDSGRPMATACCRQFGWRWGRRPRAAVSCRPVLVGGGSGVHKQIHRHHGLFRDLALDLNRGGGGGGGGRRRRWRATEPLRRGAGGWRRGGGGSCGGEWGGGAGDGGAKTEQRKFDVPCERRSHNRAEERRTKVCSPFHSF
jgi:hypothetical protein